MRANTGMFPISKAEDAMQDAALRQQIAVNSADIAELKEIIAAQDTMVCVGESCPLSQGQHAFDVRCFMSAGRL